MGEGICISTEGKGCVDGTEERRALSPLCECRWFTDVLETALNVGLLPNFQDNFSFFFFFIVFLYHESIKVKLAFCESQLCKTLKRVCLKGA